MYHRNNPWGLPPNQPPRRDQGWNPPTVQRPAGYRGATYHEHPWADVGYVPLRTEREDALMHQLAKAEGRIDLLERHVQRLEQDLTESRHRLDQWRINIRNGLITSLTVFILVWATVSVLAQRPVLPWEMPSAIMGLLGY